jgi:hypothetical protein
MRDAVRVAPEADHLISADPAGGAMRRPRGIGSPAAAGVGDDVAAGIVGRGRVLAEPDVAGLRDGETIEGGQVVGVGSLEQSLAIALDLRSGQPGEP